MPDHRTLSEGMRGEDVERLHETLDAIGIELDDDERAGKQFGPRTRDAVTPIQLVLGLDPTGTVDPATLELALIARDRLGVDRVELEAASGTRDSIRDRAILLVLLDTGLRLGELVRLSVGDVDLIEGRCRVMGKGAKERVVPIGGRTRRAVRAWVVTRRRVGNSDPLFVSRRGGRLTPRAVQQLIHRLAIAADISTRCSPHVLRHSFARAFLANGGDVFSLQRILGHSPSSLQVTRRYVQLLDDDLRAVHRRVSPVDRL